MTADLVSVAATRWINAPEEKVEEEKEEEEEFNVLSWRTKYHSMMILNDSITDIRRCFLNMMRTTQN